MSEQLFITRKRKKWKFAHFAQWSNCFDADELSSSSWPEYFQSSSPLVVELGAGTADLSVELARHESEHNFVAVDVKSDRLYSGAKISLEEKLPHIAFVRAQLRTIETVFLPASISEIWLTFPDPFPRKKQAKHRLTHPQFLQLYQRLLAPDGCLRFKTDNRELFLWSLEQFVAEGWQLRELSFDLHASDLPDRVKVATSYERRFMGQDIPINYAAFVMPSPRQL